MSPRPGSVGSPAAGPERYTACGWLVRGERVLLERRPDDARVSPGVWDVPGGHLERGESATDAMRRELREELGVEVRRCGPPVALDELEAATGAWYRHYHFLVGEWGGTPRSLEGRELSWFELGALGEGAEMHALVSEALRAFRARGWLARK